MVLPIEILIVDDEQDFADVLAARLEAKGHRVRTAASGPEALRALSEHDFDVVILDVLMPGMGGIEALREIKTRRPIVEVILLTGHGSVDTAVTGMKSGAFDYILKPPDHEELIHKLQAARKRKAEHVERIRKAEERALTRRTGDI